MKIRAYPFAGLFLSLTLVLIMPTGIGKGAVHAAEPPAEAAPLTIEVTIKNMGFSVKGYTLPGRPTSIVVRNENHLTHGFYSPLFKEVPLRLEGEGYQIVGEHGISFRLDPGKMMTLHFTKGSAAVPLTGINQIMRHVIWCDIHPEVKGELFIIETRG